MIHTNADLFNALFTPGEKINIRVIKDAGGPAENHLYVFPDAPNRTRGVSQSALSKMFNVSESNISAIVCNRTWRHK